MYQVGDYIVYGSTGVCRVEDIGTVDVTGTTKDNLYYTLAPVYSKGSKVFTPVNNEKVIMRPILTEEEAYALIDHMKDIEVLGVSDEKKREEVFKNALRTCDCVEYVRIIKTLYLRNQERLSEGKKASSSDIRYLDLAEESLYRELALPLKMQKDKVEEFILSRLDAI